MTLRRTLDDRPHGATTADAGSDTGVVVPMTNNSSSDDDDDDGDGGENDDADKLCELLSSASPVPTRRNGGGTSRAFSYSLADHPMDAAY